MNTIQSLTAVLLITMVISLASAGMAQAAPVQLGVVDYQYLIEQHPDTAKANEILRAEADKAREEYKAQSAGLNEKDKQELDRQLGTRVQQKRQALLQPIIDSVNAALKSVAEAKGMIAVLYKNTVAAGGTDITADVLQKLNGR